jgi:hypothetical protein
VPGAAEDAQRFLQKHPITLARFDRVAQLVDGFESASTDPPIHRYLENTLLGGQIQLVPCLRSNNRQVGPSLFHGVILWRETGHVGAEGAAKTR